MKILAIATRVPQLDGKGDELVSYWRIKSLRDSGHTVHLVCCLSSRPSPSDIRALDELKLSGVSVDLIHVPIVRQILNVFFSFFLCDIPAQISMYRSSECRRHLGELLDFYAPDVVHLFLIRAYSNIQSFSTRLTVDFIDSISLNYSRSSLAASPLGFLYSIEAKRCLRLERFLARSADCSFAVAFDDVNHISSQDVIFLPNGVDSNRFAPAGHIQSCPRRIIFTGNMSYLPNVEAVIWFCQECWASILSALPDASFYICGSRPSSSVLSLQYLYPSVYVTGRVESIREEICLSSVAVAPMQSGAGMQNKILEAMSCGVPVVSTSFGLGSIGAFGDPSVLIADSASEFIDSILYLFANPSFASRLGSLSRDYVIRNHDWNALGKRFVSSLESLVC